MTSSSVGEGTGLMAAVEAPPGTDMAVISKIYPPARTAGPAQGGFNAALGADDRWKPHLRHGEGRRLPGGSGCHRSALFRRSGGDRAPGCMGVPWSRTPEGRPGPAFLGGRGLSRACYAADISGHVVLHTLYERALAACARLPRVAPRGLLVEEGALAGFWFTTWQRGGGGGPLPGGPPGHRRVWPDFPQDHNGHSNTGDGTASPTGRGRCWPIWSSSNSIPPPCTQQHPDFRGGPGRGRLPAQRLRERFMARYAPQKMELAPRDVVSRSIFQEIKEGRGLGDGYIDLDLTHLGPDKILRQLPQINDLAHLYVALDPAQTPIPIEPAQHYSMGGIRVNLDCETTIPGLMAAGETANVSVHGQPPGRQLASGNSGVRPSGREAYGGGRPTVRCRRRPMPRWTMRWRAGRPISATAQPEQPGRLGGRHP